MSSAPSVRNQCSAAQDLREDADRTLEREANVFAAELLMPEAGVRAAWKELGEVEACAARFDVSPTAMHWRLYAFELVNEKPVVLSGGQEA